MHKIKTAWVVDDDDIYTFTIKRILTKAEISEKNVFFHNGKAALDFLLANLNHADQLPDLILLDLNMPVLDGWQFLDEFTTLAPKIEKKITIYIVSSSIDEDDLERAKTIELVTNFIIKPLTIHHLQDILDQLQHAGE